MERTGVVDVDAASLDFSLTYLPGIRILSYDFSEDWGEGNTS